MLKYDSIWFLINHVSDSHLTSTVSRAIKSNTQETNLSSEWNGKCTEILFLSLATRIKHFFLWKLPVKHKNNIKHISASSSSRIFFLCFLLVLGFFSQWKRRSGEKWLFIMSIGSNHLGREMGFLSFALLCSRFFYGIIGMLDFWFFLALHAIVHLPRSACRNLSDKQAIELFLRKKVNKDGPESKQTIMTKQNQWFSFR